MTVIGEKINGAIPAVSDAIASRDESVIRLRASSQAAAGADYLDCAASTEPSYEYDAMKWLIGIIESEVSTPICLDSPDASLLARLLEENAVSRPGMINSVSLEGSKCDLILPLAAQTDWNVIALTCDNDGIPQSADKRIELAKRLIEKADSYGVKLSNLHIDPCVLALATMPGAFSDFCECIRSIHEFAPDVKVAGAISNISFNMPCRKFVNMAAMVNAVNAGLDTIIMDPTSENMQGIMYASYALNIKDPGGRAYNRAYRKGYFGQKK